MAIKLISVEAMDTCCLYSRNLKSTFFFFCLTILELLLLYLSFRFLCIYLKFSPQTAKSNRIYGWPDTCIALVTIDYIHKGFKKVVFHFIKVYYHSCKSIYFCFCYVFAIYICRSFCKFFMFCVLFVNKLSFYIYEYCFCLEIGIVYNCSDESLIMLIDSLVKSAKCFECN